jgi:hypothetical protein
MRKYRTSWIVLMVMAASIGIATPSHAITGAVRVTVVKAGFGFGAGGGRGVLTFRHRNYPFTIRGVSLGITAGASVNKLVGRADYMNELGDFAGTYTVVGAGAALIGGVGGVQLKNAKGANHHLAGCQSRSRAGSQHQQGSDHPGSIPFDTELIKQHWSMPL